MRENEEKKTERFIAQSALKKNIMINSHSMTSVFALAGATAGIIGLTAWRYHTITIHFITFIFKWIFIFRSCWSGPDWFIND